MLDTSDAQLVVLVKINDKNSAHAFSVLYDRYCTKVWRYIRNLSQFDSAHVDDITQETFLKAWKSIDALKDPSLFFQWTVSIARNQAYSHIKQENRYTFIDEWMNEESAEETISKVNDQDESQHLLAHLDRDEREIITLKLNLELSFEEISNTTDNGLSAVKMKYYRAIDKLKALYKN